MNRTYFAGVDVCKRDGKARFAIAVFNARTNKFVFTSKRMWVVRVLMLALRLVGVRILKEENRQDACMSTWRHLPKGPIAPIEPLGRYTR